MRDLSAAIPKATVVLAEALGGEVIAVHLIEQNRLGIVQHSSTRRLAPYVHASTLCLHAFWPPAEEAAYEARHPFNEYGAGVWGSEASFRKFLKQTRKLGHVAWESPAKRFLVAAPVFSTEGTLLAAVGVSVPIEHLRTENEKAAVVKRVNEAVGRLHGRAPNIPTGRDG